MKLMFLDESGDHNLSVIDKTYPVFVLTGCIFDLDYYSKVVEPEANNLKIKHFGGSNEILRSYDIRKQKKGFSVLIDTVKRKAFYDDLCNFLSNLDVKIITAVIKKENLKFQYVTPNNPYDLCLQFILERSVMFLGRSGEKMLFRVESRQTHNDQKLAQVYEDFRQTDHQLFEKEEIQSKFTDLSFNQKTQNVIGMQVADLFAYPIGRWVNKPADVNEISKIAEVKYHRNPRSGDYINYGLKIFP